jgi:hypothetical protein
MGDHLTFINAFSRPFVAGKAHFVNSDKKAEAYSHNLTKI